MAAHANSRKVGSVSDRVHVLVTRVDGYAFPDKQDV